MSEGGRSGSRGSRETSPHLAYFRTRGYGIEIHGVCFLPIGDRPNNSATVTSLSRQVGRRAITPLVFARRLARWQLGFRTIHH